MTIKAMRLSRPKWRHCFSCVQSAIEISPMGSERSILRSKDATNRAHRRYECGAGPGLKVQMGPERRRILSCRQAPQTAHCGKASMSFSTLLDPVHVARAHAALEMAWNTVRSSSETERWGEDAAKKRLELFIESYALIAGDETDLANRAVERFRKASIQNPKIGAAS